MVKIHNLQVTVANSVKETTVLRQGNELLRALNDRRSSGAPQCRRPLEGDLGPPKWRKSENVFCAEGFGRGRERWHEADV